MEGNTQLLGTHGTPRHMEKQSSVWWGVVKGKSLGYGKWVGSVQQCRQRGALIFWSFTIYSGCMQQGERRPDIAFAAKNDFRELAQILRARSWASATHVGTLQSRADCTVDDIEAEGGFVPDWRISRIAKSYIFFGGGWTKYFGYPLVQKLSILIIVKCYPLLNFHYSTFTAYVVVTTINTYHVIASAHQICLFRHTCH